MIIIVSEVYMLESLGKKIKCWIGMSDKIHVCEREMLSPALARNNSAEIQTSIKH